MELHQLPVHILIDLIREGRTSPASVREYFARRIDQLNGDLNAFITVLDFARDDSGDGKPLAGVPVAVKDNISVAGVRLTCGSRMLENFEAVYDATAVARLKQAGAVIAGKTNLDEFAMGSSNEYSYFGAVKNPADPERVPGGSSGGSAAAVAAGMVPAALGSDTGGSVRQPASFCGIVGFKPSYGRISRWGLVAFASSLDQIGFLTRDVRDAALLYEITAGPDEHDATMIQSPPERVDFNMWNDRTPRVAVLSQSFSDSVAESIRDRIGEIASKLGAEKIEIPELEYAVPIYYIIAPAEASANLARYDGVRYGFRAEDVADAVDLYFRTRTQGFGPEVKRRIMIGTFVLSAGYQDEYFKRAQKGRRLLANKLGEVFERFDFVISPTTTTAAFRFGERTEDPISMYLSDYFTVIANLIGAPAISIPVHREGELPYGLQIMAAPRHDAELLSFAAAVEEKFV